MSADQFASAMELSGKQATKLLWNMKAAGKIAAVLDGKSSRYVVAEQRTTSAPQPLKSWRPSNAPAKQVAVPEASLDPELSCAIFNTGAMLIEAPNSAPLRLSPRQVAELIGYLRTLQGGLQ